MKRKIALKARKNGLGRFLIYFIQLYSHSETAAIEVKVRIGQLWCANTVR